jgi:hypothetical protein
MRIPPLLACVTTALLAAGPAAPAFAQTAAPDPAPVSVERIQRALARPEGLLLTELKSDFSVSVTENLFFPDPFGRASSTRSNEPQWLSYLKRDGAGAATAISLAAATAAALAGDGTMSAKPLIAMDVLAAAVAIAESVKTALRGRSVRKTHALVRRELEEFCALNGCAVPPDR